jgi:hypothetical protein
MTTSNELKIQQNVKGENIQSQDTLKLDQCMI